MYAYALDRLALDPARTLFVAAHPWDLEAAARHGLRTAFVDRDGGGAGASGDRARRFDVVVPDLAALADLLEPAPTA